MEKLLARPAGASSVRDTLTAMIAKIGENMSVRRAAVLGVTRTTTRPVVAGGVTTRASTTLGSAAASFTTVSAPAAGTVMKAGAAAPGPIPFTTSS